MSDRNLWYINLLIIATIIGSFFGRFGGYHDFSYHLSFPFSIELLYSPQHIYIYFESVIPMTTVIIAAIAIFHHKYAYKDQKLKKLIGLMGLVLVTKIFTAGIDHVWHLMFGIDNFISLPHLLMTATTILPLIVAFKMLRYQVGKEAKIRFWQKIAIITISSHILIAIMWLFAEYEFKVQSNFANPIIYNLALISSSTVIFYLAKRSSPFRLSATITAIFYIFTRISFIIIISIFGFKHPPIITLAILWPLIIGLFIDFIPYSSFKLNFINQSQIKV